MILGAVVIVTVGVLVVNYFRGQEPGTTLPEGVTQEGKPNTHTVSAGETLWSIAEKYYDSGYNWLDIASENSLSNPGLIEAGQELTIPDVGAKPPTVEVAESTETTEAISGATYTVTGGDSLWNIAIRTYGDGYRWVDIARENNLANPNLIHNGNIFTLPR